MIELTGRRNRPSHSWNEFTYRVAVCGEYMSLWADGRKETVYLDYARQRAAIHLTSEGWENVSIHAFDANDIFSHVVD
jgi:hypothetical protein